MDVDVEITALWLANGCLTVRYLQIPQFSSCFDPIDTTLWNLRGVKETVSKKHRIILKVWWQNSTLFVYFSYFITSDIHSITFIQYFYPPLFAEASQIFLIAFMLSGGKPPCGAGPRIELGPA